jgi:hypothetical protein
MDMSGQIYDPAALPPEKNSQTLPGLEPPIFQPLAQRCTAELYRLIT